MTNAATRLHGLARQLGRACARRYIHPAHARASLYVAICRIEAMPASQRPPNFNAAVAIMRAETTLRLSARAVADQIRAARAAIRDDARRRIDDGQPANAVLAEAHNINGETGFLLTEAQVLTVVRGVAEELADA